MLGVDSYQHNRGRRGCIDTCSETDILDPRLSRSKEGPKILTRTAPDESQPQEAS